MPPIAEEMAGGNPAGQQDHLQQPTQKTKRPRSARKRSHSPKSGTGTSSESSKVSDELLPHQRKSQFLTVGIKPIALESSNSLSSDDAEVVPSLNTMQVSTGSKSISGTQRETNTMDQYSSDPSMASEFFKKEPCLYSHRMFQRAATIFTNLKATRDAKMEKRKTKAPAAPAAHSKKGKAAAEAVSGANHAEPEMERLDFRNVKEKKLTYELAFASLKFEVIFEDMLDDCAFFTVYPDLKDHECLVMVVLWDYQSRKFQPRVQFDADELSAEVTVIEKAILDQKIKLAASLARRRIKEAAPTIDFLLPDKLRNKGSSTKPMPVYVWVNTYKISPPELLSRLKEDKFIQLWAPPKTEKDFQCRSFYLDVHCSDVLVFSMDCHTLLQEHPLIEEGFMVKQDKSSCMAAHSVTHLLGDEQDVIVVKPGSGITAAHVAVLLKDRKGAVFVVSEGNTDEYNAMMRTFELTGVMKHMRVLRETFLDINPDDPRFKSVRAALVTADCSKSAINNIVNFIVTEGENLTMLQDLSETSGDVDEHINNLQTNHVGILRHALKLNRIQGVSYVTRSIYDQENDQVVQKAIEYVNMVQMPKNLRPWRVIPPVLPFSSDEIDDQNGIVGKNAFFLPTTMANGCFIVCIAREPEDVKATRATALRGSLTGKSSKSKVKGTGSSSSGGSSEAGGRKLSKKKSKTK